MSLLSGFNVTAADVHLLAQAAIAAFRGGPVPSGWSVITPQQLGVAPQYWDGSYFTNNGASAIVLQQGSSWIVSFRGTDGSNDVSQYPQLAFGTYINNFQPLLSAVASQAPAGTSFSFTGSSLGGGATNLMADIAASQFGGMFASAKFVAFASPNISNASGILNIGMENDPVYKAINGYGDFPSSLDNLVLANAQYMAGNYDGRHPQDSSAHTAKGGLDALARLQSSVFFDQMSPDSVVVFDAFGGLVQDITPGRENTGAFYIGEDVADAIAGRNGGDHLEGFAGNDLLFGGGFKPDGSFAPSSGNDALEGGDGDDGLWGADGDDVLSGGAGSDGIVGGAGNDSLDGGDGVDFQFGGDFSVADGSMLAGSGDDALNGGAGNDGLWGFDGNDVIKGDAGDDYAEGGAGNDTVMGGADNDTLLGQDGADVVGGGAGFDYLYGGTGADVFVFNRGDSYDTVWDFSAAEGDRIRLDPAFGVATLADLQGRLSGFTLDGADYSVIDFPASIDKLTIKGIAATAWTADLLA